MIFRRLSLKICVIAIFVSQIEAYNFSKCAEFYLNTSQVFTIEADFDANLGANRSKNSANLNGTDSRTKEIRAIHIGDGKYLAFIGTSVETITSQNILFYDRFVGLALFSGKKISQKYDLIPITQSIQNLPLAAVTSDSITQGKILQSQKSLKNKAIFSHQIPQNAVISDICYQSYGLSVGDNRFIDKSYISRFFAENGAKIYSDIGFEVKAQKSALIVSYVNPFVRFMLLGANQSANRANLKDKTPESLRVGDELLAINGISIKNEDDFFDNATNLDITKKATIRVRRGGKVMEFAFIPMKRMREFDERGSILDFFGIVVDENLNVIRAPLGSIFRQRDKILRLNQIIVENKAELDSAILRVLRQKSDFSFLITRKDFEFFITFKNGYK